MPKKALLVTELQNDYLWEKRKPKFPYDTEKLISAVNDAIARLQAEDCDIIYLSQIFPDAPTNHIVFGFCIEGTEGAALYGGLHIVSEYRFEKNVADAFLDPQLAAFLKEQGYEKLLLCGLDECGSIAATAKGAVNAGLRVSILKDCTATRFPMNKLGTQRAELKSLGVSYI